MWMSQVDGAESSCMLLIQNEEFMAELRSDTDFMAALQLEHDEAAVR